MRIILTSHIFLPHGTAGTEVLTFHTARELKKLGHEVSVFTTRIGSGRGTMRSFTRYEHEGIPVVCMLPGGLPAPQVEIETEAEYNSRFVGAHFEAYVEEAKPDVVHFVHLANVTAALVDVCHRHGVPMVFTPTDFWFMCPTFQLRLPSGAVCAGPDLGAINCFKHFTRKVRPKAARILKYLPAPVLRKLFSWVRGGILGNSRMARSIAALQERQGFLREQLQKIDRIIVPSTTLMAKLKTYNLDESRVILSRYGIDLEPYRGIKKTALNSPLTIGFIGTLSGHKGAHILLKSFRRLPADLNVRLKIYGHLDEQSAYAESLKDIAAGDPRVEFCGSFPNAKIGQVLEGIDALCIPSIWLENTPLVLLSALAAGVPVIASDVGGLSEMLQDGINGFLFPVGDDRRLSRILLDLAAQPETLLRLSRAIVPPKSIASYAEEMNDIYRQLAPQASAP